ncbi:zinc-binding dehydrogenase [Streptomyces griseofuscus]|uniref:zinc-binding dehydrogenase n=1 Tax=Streptomyces griseofuscus TaxID=146922 RepID=UPI00380758DC
MGSGDAQCGRIRLYCHVGDPGPGVGGRGDMRLIQLWPAPLTAPGGNLAAALTRAGREVRVADRTPGAAADEVIDYRAVRFEDVVSDVDVVLDGLGGETAERSLKVLRPGGRLITLQGPDDVPAPRDGVRAVWLLVEPDHLGLREVTAPVERGALSPVIDTAVPLTEAARAHEVGERSRTTGKIMLTVV